VKVGEDDGVVGAVLRKVQQKSRIMSRGKVSKELDLGRWV